jgi:DNA-binding NarL/FixJ family response regulator
VNKKILVVDDHPMIFKAVESVAKELIPDVGVLYANSISKALRAYRDNLDIRLVLLDLTLPDSRHTEGIAVLLQEFPKIPIVVYSGQNEDSVRRACLRSGAKDFLYKNSDPKLLFETISSFLDVNTHVFKDSPTKPAVVLSARQALVLKLLLNGLTGRESANLMGIGESTVKSHIKKIYKRTHCHNRVELVNWFAQAERYGGITVTQDKLDQTFVETTLAKSEIEAAYK